ncbi:MAG: hypothetical protein ACM34I_00065 [bacterium]
MNMRMSIAGVWFFVLAQVFPLHAAEIVRYEFQVGTREGTYEIYRVDIDFSQKQGDLCFLNTGGTAISEETIALLRKGSLWSKYVDMAKERPACFLFELCGSRGWFYSPPFKYDNQDYRVFFTGEITEEQIKGTLFQFISYQAGSRQYKTTEERQISAPGVIVKK